MRRLRVTRNHAREAPVTVRLLLRGARLDWPPWPGRAHGKSCASPVYRNGPGTENAAVWSADKAARLVVVSPNRCGKRTPGEQSLRWMVLTRRQIKDRALRRSAPSRVRGGNDAHLCAIIERRR